MQLNNLKINTNSSQNKPNANLGKRGHEHVPARILPHKKRIDIIFLNVVHNISINKLSLMVKHHYSTVSNIIQTYKEEGRTSQVQNHTSYVQDDQKDSEINGGS